MKLSLNVFRADRGRYPDALSELLEPTDSFPRGFLEETGATNDGWGRELRYLAEEDGGSFRLWSKGPNGADDDGAGDDVLPR